jgi:hypothetical protein
MPDRLVQARSSSIEVNPTFLDYLLKYPLTILAERTWQWSKKPKTIVTIKFCSKTRQADRRFASATRLRTAFWSQVNGYCVISASAKEKYSSLRTTS